MEQEPLLHLRPQTDSEKLLWTYHEIKSLKKDLARVNMELGILQSELDEYKYLMKKEEVGALILKNKSLKEEICAKDLKLKKLKKENAELISKIARMNLAEIQKSNFPLEEIQITGVTFDHKEKVMYAKHKICEELLSNPLIKIFQEKGYHLQSQLLD